MIRRPPRSTRTDTLFPYTTRFRSETGVVGLLRNGEGPTVMLRADMDALPIAEDTGLTYASKVTATDAEGNVVPVAHMCGHDMHVAWQIGRASSRERVCQYV